MSLISQSKSFPPLPIGHTAGAGLSGRESTLPRFGFYHTMTKWTPAFAGVTVLLLLSLIPAQNKKFNVLFIAIDDFKPLIGAQGEDYMITPNLDKLASEGTLFNRHYVQRAVCNVSRNSMLRSIRPGNSNPSGNPDTFGELFRDNGYYTSAIGKISHAPDSRQFSYNGDGTGDASMPGSWDDYGLPYGEWEYGWGAFFGYAGGTSREGPNAISPAPIYEDADVEDTGYPDGLIADSAVNKIKELNAKGDPFLLAVGFFKPHLPFTSPKKYWDLYDPNDIPLTEFPDAPENTEKPYTKGSTEWGQYSKMGLTGDEMSRKLIHAYAACVSYVDAQVGKLLQTLEDEGLAQNTIVVVWGDHGWHLGDLSFWGKHTNHEHALRSTMLYKVPGMAPGFANGIVESVDIYPTLAALTGIEVPTNLDGESLVHLLQNPSLPGKSGALATWVNNGYTGTTVRTDEYRLTQWVNGDGDIGQTELYIHAIDSGETVNVAAENPDIVNSLLPMLEDYTSTYAAADPVSGCMMPGFAEFDASATFHDAAACLTEVAGTLNSAAFKSRLHITSGGGSLTLQYNNSSREKPWKVKILTPKGALMHSSSSIYSSFYTLKTSSWARGIYLVKIKTSMGPVLRKIVIQGD